MRRHADVEAETLLGILLVDKPVGITSHDVVNSVRRRFGTKRVGHAGTLDPLASGVLVLAVGPATRFLQYLPLEPKCYLADILFGASTETYDREGPVVGGGEIPENLLKALSLIQPAYVGLISQIPPMYSAVKVNGQPLYKYARKGEVLERESRSVHISLLDFLEQDGPIVKTKVVCSGGTYIRTLANDIGESLGCGAHLNALQRTSVGKFDLSQCKHLEAIDRSDLIPLKDALPPMALVQLDQIKTRHLREGRSVKIDCTPSNEMVGLLDPNGEVFSVARLLGNVLQPECVIPENSISDAI